MSDFHWEIQGTDSVSIHQQLDSILVHRGALNYRINLHKLVYSKARVLKAIYSLESWELEVDSLVFINEEMVYPMVSSKIFQPLMRIEPGTKLDRNFDRIKTAYPFINDHTSYTLGRYDERKLAAIVDFQPEFASRFSGIIGLSRSDQDDLLVTGELDLHLENIWHTAGIVEVEWQRKNELSQNIEIAIEEPAPFGAPLGFRAEFEQKLEQGLYVRLQSGLGIITNFSPLGSWQVGGQNITVTPTDDGDSAGVAATSSASIYTTLTGDRRNNRWLPTAGNHWEIFMAYGTHTGQADNDYLARYRFEYQHYQPVFNKLVLHGRFSGAGYFTRTGDQVEAEQIQFGGASTLRGYPEAFYSADQILLSQTELIYRSSNSLHLLCFYDAGIGTGYHPFPAGYGCGIIQQSEGAILELSYGLTPSSAISEGRIHIRISGKL